MQMTSNGPLTGIRLIEMDAIGPVPLAGMILSGLGAEIVRIAPPAKHGIDAGEAVLFRGRTHVTLDLKNPADRDKLLDLVALSDGIMEGSRPGVMERLGLGYEELKAVNPALIVCSISGYGRTGPMARVGGFEGGTYTLDDAREQAQLRAEMESGPGAVGGGAFCAGADLQCMQSDGPVLETPAMRDAHHLLRMFRAIDEFPCPVIARVQGSHPIDG